MEKKKVTKKTTKKTTTKKATPKKKTNNKKKKGFTLIELLAVIIILGVLMIIAIPSVTTYISNSRKSSYIDTAKNIVGGARNLVNEGKLEMYDPTVTYYIPVSCIKTENGTKTPYGEFTQAYVGVIYNGTGYKYYWISVDESGQGIDKVTPSDKIEPEDIKSGIKANDIENTVKTIGVGERENIKIYNCNNSWEEYVASDSVDEDGGNGGPSVIQYPPGKTKNTVEVGDIVTIGTEEFYVVKHDGKDLVLLAHYNLNVGKKMKANAPEGMQDSDVRGWRSVGSTYGTVPFASNPYWNSKIGTDYPGSYCDSSTYTVGSNCAYVYYDKNKIVDSNNSIGTYINSYKEKLEDMGAVIKDARLLRIEEIFEIACESGQSSCSTNPLPNCPSWINETSYWLGSAYHSVGIWCIMNNSSSLGWKNYSKDTNQGVRPVIVI